MEFVPNPNMTAEEAKAIPEDDDQPRVFTPPKPAPVPVRSVVSELPSSKKRGGKKDDDEEIEVGARSSLAKGLDILSQSNSPVEEFKHIPTGSVAVDRVTNGGWPRPMVIEEYSEEGVGKTTIALMSVKTTVLYLREHAVYLDYEHGIQLSYLDQLGIPYANLTVTDADVEERLGPKWLSLDNSRVQAEKQVIRRERILKALASKKALMWVFAPTSFEEGWDIMRVLNGYEDEEGEWCDGILQKPAAITIIDSYAAMAPSMNIKFGDRPMQQGMMGAEFLRKVIHHLMGWDQTLFILNHLRTDVGRMMWDKHRPSYLPPPKKSYSSEVLKFIAQLRVHLKRAGGGKLEVETMDASRGEKSKTAIGHMVVLEQEKQKSHTPKPATFCVMYGYGIDNVDAIILLGVHHKFIEMQSKSSMMLGEWAPQTPNSKGKLTQPIFSGRREMSLYLRKNPEILKTLVNKVAEVDYLPTASMFEVHDKYNPETRTYNEAQTHIKFAHEDTVKST
jgi:RecA/RadA recombinase